MAFTDVDVRAIAPNIHATLSINGWVTTAKSITARLNGLGAEIFTEAQLDQIGIYVTAHLVYMSPGSGVDGTAKSESIAKGQYSRTLNAAVLGNGIMGSEYGQLANMLSNGLLMALDQPQVGIFAIGTSNAD